MAHEQAMPQIGAIPILDGALTDSMVDALEADLADEMDEFNERAAFGAAWEGR